MNTAQAATTPGDFPSDPDVIAARNGDRDAFSRLVTRYRGLVSSISLSTVGHPATSEDVAQEVFVTAWRDLGTLRNPASFLAWLRQLTRHRALDACRGRRRRDRPRGDEGALEAAVDPRPTAQDALLDGERARALEQALDALPDDAREVIVLYYREGQSIEQVSRLLGLREDAAKKRLSRARAALRDDVLTRMADVVGATTPGDDFTTRVMGVVPAMSYPAAAAGAKGMLSLFGKGGALAMAASNFIGLLGWIPGFFAHRRELRKAIDERERKQLWLIFISAVLNTFLFCGLGIPALPPRSPATAEARALWGIALVVVFGAIHLAIFGVWRPRVMERRRRAEMLADPTVATRHAREDRRARVGLTIAALSLVASMVAIWIFR